MTYLILDNGVEREATPEEAADIDTNKAAPPLVPQSVSRYQGLAALELAGHLSTLESMMENPATPKLTKLAFENAQTFERNSQTLVTLAAALNLSDADVDALFIAAYGIKA
jgi:hypothetical protein